MKKIIWVLVLGAIAAFIIWSKDPLNESVNFIIGGSVPGTKIVLGFWPTLGFVAALLLLIRRGLKNTRLQMLENTAKQIKTEAAKSEFKDQNSGEFDPKKRSVIAARKTELSV